MCNLCQGRELGDEYHYLFEFTEFKHDRARLIPEKYRCRPNAVKYLYNNVMLAMTMPI